MKIPYLNFHKAFFLGILSLFFCKANSQELPTIIPQAPDVMAMQKYGDIPVGHYTGTPNISIPIYTINTRAGLSIPIALSYHASGIKVDEKASRVGLGWSISNLFSISKDIIGQEDTGAIIPDVNYFNPNYYTNLSEYQYALGVSDDEFDKNDSNFFGNTMADSGYDIYRYNILGRSGKFIIDRNDKVHTIPYEPLKIEPTNPTNLFFKITDELGNEYHFNTFVTSTLDRLFCSSNIFNNIEIVNSAYLSKIVTYLGEEIIFNYRTFSYDYIISQEEVDKFVSSTFQNYGCAAGTNITCDRKMTHADQVLSSITYNGTTLNFEYSDATLLPIQGSNTRLDFPNNHALRKIVVKDNNNITVKDFELLFDYFYVAPGTTSDNYRLKLTKVIDNGLTAHEFEYNESINLPKRFAYSQDSWGFYNGVTSNNSLIPQMVYGKESLSGADRSVSTTHSQANILNKIIYPTKGYSFFEYENNTYYASSGIKFWTPKFINFPNADTGVGANNSHPFTIGSDFINIKLSLVNDCDNGTGNSSDPPVVGDTLCSVRILNSSNVIVWDNYLPNNYDLNSLSNGNYTLEYYNLWEDCLCSATISYDLEETTAPLNVSVGGLRVKKIDHFDGTNHTYKHYEYNTPGTTQSSGLKQGEPIYSTISISAQSQDPNHSNYLETCSYIVRNSSSVYPLTCAVGKHVGYTYVTEREESAISNNRTEYEFTNAGPGYNTGYYQTLLEKPVDVSWRKGNLITKKLFKSDNNIIKKEEYKYAYDNSFASFSSDYYGTDKIAVGYAIRLVKDDWEDPILYIYTPAEFESSHYFIKSSWIQKTEHISTSYFGTDSLKVITNYFYENTDHAQRTRVETTDSYGDVLKTITYYPHDVLISTDLGFDNLTTNEKIAIDSLKSQHRKAESIQIETYKNNVLLSAQRSNYKDWGTKPIGNGNFVLAETVQTLKGTYNASTNPLEDRIIYHSFDAKGNPTEVSKTDGTHIVYIWGYSETRPIAKIENATYAQVSGFVTNLQNKSNLDIDTISENTLRTALDDMRNDAALTNAMVTTYTYDPLIGVTSITDPKGYTIYYIYDPFNRLKEVKDANGNLITDYQYNYKN